MTAPMNDWNGVERRIHPMHMQPLAECLERNKAIFDKLDTLILRLDKMNGRYDSHLIESVTYRTVVGAHTKRFDAAEKQTQWIIGLMVSMLFTIVLQVCTFAFLWGQLTQRVAVDTHSIEILEGIEREAQKVRTRNVTKIDEIERTLDHIDTK